MTNFQILHSRRPRVYLAGPSVFRPNAKEHLASLAAQCERHGLEPLLPTDDCGGAADAPLARRIYESNTQMLRSADGERVIEVEHASLYDYAVQRFHAAIAGEGTPAATGQDGYRSLLAALALAQSAQSGAHVTVDSRFGK